MTKKRVKDLARDTNITKSPSTVRCGMRHAALFGCVEIVYVCTVHPSVTGGDAGELLAEACHFGVPHPPGYPLFTLLHYMLNCALSAGGVRALPIGAPPTECLDSTPGTQALAANLLSCCLGATTAVLIAVAIEEWTIGSKTAYNRGAAAAGALLFCFSPLAWEFSTGAEVFALNNLLVSLALVIAARAANSPKVREARIGAVVLGLAVANQHSAVVVLGPLALLVLYSLSHTRLLSWRTVASWGAVWLPLGLSPYWYLVFSAQTPTEGSWGDLSSIRGFARHFLRQEYGTMKLGMTAPNAAGSLDRIREYVWDTFQQTTKAGPVLAVLGVAWALFGPVSANSKGSPQMNTMHLFGAGLTAAWGSYVVVWHAVFSNISLEHPMSRAVHSRFWIQPNILLCVAAGAGIGVVMNSSIALCWRCWPRSIRPKQQRFGVVASLLLTVFVGAAVIWPQRNVVNRGMWSSDSAGWTMHLYGQAMLSSMPPRAILLSHTDLDLNAARYLRLCERLRTDVTQISLQMMPYEWWETVQVDLHQGIIFPPILPGVSTRRDSEGNAVLVGRFLAANLPLGRPIFLDMQAVDETEIGTVGEWRGFSLVPHGLTYRVLPRMSPYESECWHKEVVLQIERLEACISPAPTEIYPPGTWEFAASSVYWDAHYQAALFFLSYAIAVSGNAAKAGQRPNILPAIRQASHLLLHTLEAADAHGTFSSPRADLLKNTVLAQIRLYYALRVALALASKNDLSVLRRVDEPIPAAMESMVTEMMWAKEQCLLLIPRFLLESEDDRDAEVFGKEYIRLRGEG